MRGLNDGYENKKNWKFSLLLLQPPFVGKDSVALARCEHAVDRVLHFFASDMLDDEDKASIKKCLRMFPTIAIVACCRTHDVTRKKLDATNKAAPFPTDGGVVSHELSYVVAAVNYHPFVADE